MQIDRRRLTELSEEVDDLHHQSMATVREGLAEVHFGEVADRLRPSRRRVLAGAAAGSAALAAGSGFLPVGGLLTPAGSAEADDLALARFAAGLELAAVAAYNVASGTGRLSGPTAAIASMFAGHHQDHADALNAIVGEEEAVGKPNAAVLKRFAPRITRASDEKQILGIGLAIEEAATSTYYFALGVIEDPQHAGALATILPVESQHATVLGTLLGREPDSYLIDFVTADHALDPDDFPVD